MACNMYLVYKFVSLLIFLKINPRYAQPNLDLTQTGRRPNDLITEADRIKNRIDSFQGWAGTKTPTQLAIGGFRYTGTSDKVVCDTCGLKLYNWRESDDAIQAHKQYSPGCDFIRKWFSGEENVPEIHDAQDILPPPRHPLYITYQQRVDSFIGWPLKHEHQSPSNMAQNGFFYIGSADRVACFQCGLRLRDWDEDDYPSECHKEWSSNCPFINKAVERSRPGEPSSGVPNDTKKSSDEEHERKNLTESHTSATGNSHAEVSSASGDTEYNTEDIAGSQTASAAHNSTIEASSDVNKTEDSRNEEHEDSCGANIGNTASGGVAEDQADENTYCRDVCHVNWSSPKVQAVLEMGCEKKVVEQVTVEHFRTTGKDFPNAVLLFEAILKIESSSM